MRREKEYWKSTVKLAKGTEQFSIIIVREVTRIPFSLIVYLGVINVLY